MPIIRRNNCVYATLDTCYSVWMNVWYATCNLKNILRINILRKIVHQVGFIYKTILGCRSTKHKTKNESVHILSIRRFITWTNFWNFEFCVLNLRKSSKSSYLTTELNLFFSPAHGNNVPYQRPLKFADSNHIRQNRSYESLAIQILLPVNK